MLNKFLKCIFVLIRYQNFKLTVFASSILFDYRLLFLAEIVLDLLVDSERSAGDNGYPVILFELAVVALGVSSQHEYLSVEANCFFGFKYGIFTIVLIENQNHWLLEIYF